MSIWQLHLQDLNIFKCNLVIVIFSILFIIIIYVVFSHWYSHNILIIIDNQRLNDEVWWRLIRKTRSKNLFHDFIHQILNFADVNCEQIQLIFNFKSWDYREKYL